MTKKLNSKRLIMVSRLLFVVYMFFALYFLLFAEAFGRMDQRDEYAYNLELFKEIKRYINWANMSEYGFKAMLLNIFGNILCFVPFGFFMPMVFKRLKNGIVITIMTFLFSLSVEIIQLVFKIGSFDVDDILLNTLGGIIGYIGYFISKIIYKQMVSKSKGKGI